MKSTVIVVLTALLLCTSDITAGGPPTANATRALGSALMCPAQTLRAIVAAHNGARGPVPQNEPASRSVMCELAYDALCASTPDATGCKERPAIGAYGGYYVARRAMPVIAWLRSELHIREDRTRDEALLELGLQQIATLLDLLDPGLDGCDGANGLRTWCTVGRSSEAANTLVASHRYTVAHFASEILRLLVECRAGAAHCPDIDDGASARRIALWFDLLLWDHVLLDATPVRNSFTQRFSFGSRLEKRLHALSDQSASSDAPFLFDVEGRVFAVAANLLAIDTLLDDADDPRIGALDSSNRQQLDELTALAHATLEARADTTSVYDFSGEPVAGAQFDVTRWDHHPFRRFSAVTSEQRPFQVIAPRGKSNTIKVTARVPQPQVQPGTGIDSGHYRRVMWLYYTLHQTAKVLDRDWADEHLLTLLANQFAYAMFLHRCHGGTCLQETPATPRFANYSSGHDGWYRITYENPCAAGVPPSGFSIQMLLSEHRWWAHFNPDIERIWRRLDAAIADPKLAPPSSGDAAQCGRHAGEKQWHVSYYDALRGAATNGVAYYQLAYLAMQRWAWFALSR